MAKQNFGAFGGGAGMQQLMRQAQKLQEQMAQAQEALDKCEYEASSGGGMVTAKVSGARQLLSLNINKGIIDADDKEILEDMVCAAVNEALRNAESARQEELGRFGPQMGGMF